MLTVKNIDVRLAVIEENITMYEEERTALSMLKELYQNPKYAGLLELEELSELKVMKRFKKEEKKKEVKSSLKKMSDKSSKKNDSETYTIVKMTDFIRKKPVFAQDLLKMINTKLEIRISVIDAKKYGMSTNTLSKLMKSCIKYQLVSVHLDGRSKSYYINPNKVSWVREITDGMYEPMKPKEEIKPMNLGMHEKSKLA